MDDATAEGSTDEPMQPPMKRVKFEQLGVPYGDIKERLEGLIQSLRKSNFKSSNCVNLARALDRQLRHPFFPFSIDEAKSLEVESTQVAFPYEVDIPQCDRKKCYKKLWNEEAWLPVGTRSFDAYCKPCGYKVLDNVDGVPKQRKRSSDGMLFELDTTSISRFILSSEVEVQAAAAASSASSQPHHFEETSHSAMAEVIDGDDFQSEPTEGVVQMHRSTKKRLAEDLQGLRRRKSNGLMSGIIHFLFKAELRTKTKQGHLANFVVSNESDKNVFFVNLQTKQVVTDVNELTDVESYTDDIFFLPSPEKASDIESVAAAVASARAVKMEEEEEEDERYSGGGKGKARASAPYIKMEEEDDYDDAEAATVPAFGGGKAA